MDILMRGLYEKYLDKKLEEDETRVIMDLIDSIDLPISREDVFLGYILGSASVQLRNFSLAVNDRVPEPDELECCQKILVRRAPEIMARLTDRGLINEEEAEPLDLVSEAEEIGEDFLEVEVEEAVEAESEEEQPIVSEIELSPVATIDDSEEAGKSMKFSFSSRSVKKPLAKVLGIPVKR